MAELQYPECEKMQAVRAESLTLSGFLDWLDEQRITLCDLEGDEYYPCRRSKEQLLAGYFKIDLNKVEEERRAILESIREKEESDGTT